MEAKHRRVSLYCRLLIEMSVSIDVSVFAVRSDIQTGENLFMLGISIYYYVQVRICMLIRRFI